MVKLPTFLVVHRFPNFRLKIKLGALLLCSTLFLNYQPTLNFPPLKTTVVFAEITQQRSVSPQASAITFQLPHPGYITTPFSTYHPGIDLCSGLGTPIKPISKGTVVETGYNFFGLGLVVEVEHENGYRSLYAHMGKIYVQKGQSVDSNDFLGEIGMTGHTSGPHTHLEVSKDGKKIDPRLILPEIRGYPTESDFAVTTSATPSAVLAPTPKPTSSPSPQIKTPQPSPQTPTIENLIKEIPQIIPASTKPEVKENVPADLKKQTISQILNLASPKPTSAPIPVGGSISLRNFSLLGFKH